MRFRVNWLTLYSAEACGLLPHHTPALIGVTTQQFGCWDATALDTVQIVAIKPTTVWCCSNGANPAWLGWRAEARQAMPFSSNSLSRVDGVRSFRRTPRLFFGSILEENCAYPLWFQPNFHSEAIHECRLSRCPTFRRPTRIRTTTPMTSVSRSATTMGAVCSGAMPWVSRKTAL